MELAPALGYIEAQSHRIVFADVVAPDEEPACAGGGDIEPSRLGET